MGRVNMHWRAAKAALYEGRFGVGFALGWVGGLAYANLVFRWTLLHP